MKKEKRRLTGGARFWVALGLLLILTGCSHFDSPVMSQNAEPEMGLWNPRPGDQIVPGRDVPILSSSGEMSTDGMALIAMPVSAVIGREGGRLRLGLHSLVVPAGAVDREVTFTMSCASLSGIAVDCGPSPFSFNVPVALTLSYSGTQYESGDRQGSLQIFYMANATTCIPMPSRADANSKTVTAELDHFSRYIIG